MENYYGKLKALYNQINLDENQIVDIDKIDKFQLTVKIAFIKSLQINQYIYSEIENENSYLFLSTLRGICEEIIILKFINESIARADQSPFIESMIYESLKKELKAQAEFIKKYRPLQPVLDERLYEGVKNRQELSIILNRNGIKGGKIPSTEQLAKKVGVSELYDYLYRASCSFVHFNPRVMMRTVWYENEKYDQSKISIMNFNKYYFSFSSFYSSYLFVLIYDYFKQILNLDAESCLIIEKIKETIQNTYHYPELITFEEFNLKRPEVSPFNTFLMNNFSEKKIFNELIIKNLSILNQKP